MTTQRCDDCREIQYAPLSTWGDGAFCIDCANLRTYVVCYIDHDYAPTPKQYQTDLADDNPLFPSEPWMGKPRMFCQPMFADSADDAVHFWQGNHPTHQIVGCVFRGVKNAWDQVKKLEQRFQ